MRSNDAHKLWARTRQSNLISSPEPPVSVSVSGDRNPRRARFEKKFETRTRKFLLNGSKGNDFSLKSRFIGAD